MTSVTLAQSYLVKAIKRLKILPVLLAEEAYSDVVREAQEIVELAVKGILRYIGIEPPKQNDVGYLLVEFQDRLPEEVRQEAGKIAKISKWLRKEREFAFYGDVDFIPTEEYTEQDARRGMQDANFVVHGLRSLKAFRHLPIVFVDGTGEVIARTKTKVTEAIYTTSAELKSILKKFVSGEEYPAGRLSGRDKQR